MADLHKRLADGLHQLADRLGTDPERDGLHDLNPYDLSRGRSTVERLADGYARGSYDNSEITARGIRGLPRAVDELQ